jgi:hypothetical protein
VEKVFCKVVRSSRMAYQNTNFSGTSFFMKIESCCLTNSLSQLYTSPSSSYDSFLGQVHGPQVMASVFD